MANTTKKATVQVRIDAEVKKQAVEVLNSVGMDTSTAINVFFRQVIADKGLPFQPHQRKFNEETIAAIKEADEMIKNGSAKTYTSIDELFDDALRDD